MLLLGAQEFLHEIADLEESDEGLSFVLALRQVLTLLETVLEVVHCLKLGYRVLMEQLHVLVVLLALLKQVSAIVFDHFGDLRLHFAQFLFPFQKSPFKILNVLVLSYRSLL